MKKFNKDYKLIRLTQTRLLDDSFNPKDKYRCEFCRNILDKTKLFQIKSYYYNTPAICDECIISLYLDIKDKIFICNGEKI